MFVFIVFLALVLSVGSVQAQSKPWSPEYKRSLHEASIRRRAEIQRRNWAQQEAINMLFGPRGIPALTRPSDPWNAYRGGMRRYQGGYSGGYGGYGGYSPVYRGSAYPR